MSINYEIRELNRKQVGLGLETSGLSEMNNKFQVTCREIFSLHSYLKPTLLEAIPGLRPLKIPETHQKSLSLTPTNPKTKHSHSLIHDS